MFIPKEWIGQDFKICICLKCAQKFIVQYKCIWIPVPIINSCPDMSYQTNKNALPTNIVSLQVTI